jgi:hypothetical protein
MPMLAMALSINSRYSFSRYVQVSLSGTVIVMPEPHRSGLSCPVKPVGERNLANFRSNLHFDLCPFRVRILIDLDSRLAVYALVGSCWWVCIRSRSTAN